MDKTNTQTNHVQLMTLHAVKGLEFNTILISGLEEGLLPSSRSLYSTSALEEERRLFYVGMTRAKERLILFHAQQRNSYGQITEQSPSRFVTELPETLLHQLDACYTPQAQIRSAFCNWLGIKQPAAQVITFGTTHRKTQKNVHNKAQWRKNQPVLHKTFGAGVIKEVEKRGNDDYHLTIMFKTGKKKLLSRFVKTV